MRRLKIEHTTNYLYSDTVTLQMHKLLLRPREGHDIRIEFSQLNITPIHSLKWQRDVYGNSVGVVTFAKTSSRLSIMSGIVLQHYEDRPLDFLVTDYAVQYPFLYAPEERVDLGPYLVSMYPNDADVLRDWLTQFWQPDQRVETYVLLDSINKAIAQNFIYRMREEPGVQTPAQTLAKRSGSCRDYATLFIEACRYLGLAARFVSGYLYDPAIAPGNNSTHAWSEVYLPGAGWKGFDSTCGQVVGYNHIAVAVHRHSEAIPPVSGAFVATTPQSPVMQVQVDVSAL